MHRVFGARCGTVPLWSIGMLPIGCSRRSIHFPVNNGSNEQGWTMPRTHHLSASVGLQSTIKTACGRVFDPNIYQEILQACCDQHWLQAMQRGLVEDTEYVEMVRTHGGTGLTIQEMSQGVSHDDEFMEKLKERLRTDKNVALTLCAMQDCYLRIRRKRDGHETQVAADGGHDPYAAMKRQKMTFGQIAPSGM